jgi:hypothetical protein
MIDKNMVEVINKVMREMCYDEIGDVISKRLHDAGYRRVPDAVDIDTAMRIKSKQDLGDDMPCRMAQYIHDLMIGDSI